MTIGSETARLRSLMDYRVLDTGNDEAFDRLTSLAADLFDVPIAIVTLLDVDRQWFKSQVGLTGHETPRDFAFCAHAVQMERDAVFVVEDASRDERFAGNPLVTGEPHIRFYAGAVLTTPEGHNLGALCIIDTKPRPYPSETDLRRLRTLARVVVDELELHRARRQAEENQRQLELAEHMAAIGHWRLDLITGVLTWSDELYRIHGVARETFRPSLGEVIKFYRPDDQAMIHRAVGAAIAGTPGFEFELHFQRADGEWLDATCKAVSELNAAGEVVSLAGVFQDVTDLRAQERALAASEARYRLIANHASDMILQSDARGKISYVSPSVEQIIGYRAEELIGRRALEFINPEDHAGMREAVFAQINSGGDAPRRQVEHRARHKDGREIWLEAKPSLAYDPVTGEICGITDVIRDIAPRKALEQALRDARAEAEAATAVKSEFLANMSHELRTPLTSIIGFTGLIAAQPELSDVSRGFVERVGDASRALLATVNDVLDFSKLEAGQVSIEPQPTDPAKLCRATLALFAPQAGAKDLSLDFDSDIPDGLAVSLDPDRVRQVLLNFLGNAVKFSASGGVSLRLRWSDGRLRVEVADTGPGMTPEQQAKLFQRFADVDASLSRKSGGTGLGLAICKGLVEAMGGEIGVQSQREVGSRFWFELPAPPVAQESQEPGVAGSSVPLLGIRVLVVDDHAANRELVQLFLSGVGGEVTQADSGAAAIRVAAELPFDAILMDLNMPGMSGLQACGAIRGGDGPNQAAPVLAFTATAPDDLDLAELAAIGFDGIVSKPLDPAALIAAVARATDFTAAQVREPEELRRSV
ncbi:MAG TPA: PAS domain S-box protein [Phenylobacterium sp.]